MAMNWILNLNPIQMAPSEGFIVCVFLYDLLVLPVSLGISSKYIFLSILVFSILNFKCSDYFSNFSDT